MSILKEAIAEVMTLSGTVACAIVDIESGECLARAGVTVSGMLETAGLVNARMLRAKLSMVSDLSHDTIEDILITLGAQYHIIRLIHAGGGVPSMFIYLMLDRSLANLAISRRKRMRRCVRSWKRMDSKSRKDRAFVWSHRSKRGNRSRFDIAKSVRFRLAGRRRSARRRRR